MKKHRIIFYISTGLLTAMTLLAVFNYFFNTAEISEAFLALGYPTYLIYPLATAKLLGLIALWFSPSRTLKEWAYAGFSFNILLAFAAHLAAQDGDFPGPIIFAVFLAVSYWAGKQIEKA